MRASHYSQTKRIIWGDFGYDAPSRKVEKNLMNFELEIMDFGLDIGSVMQSLKILQL